MKKFVFLILLLLWPSLAVAQSSPNFFQGFVPTAGQWKSYFAAKQDLLGYTAINKAGDTMLGRLKFTGAVPALSDCGAGPSVSGNDSIGEITMGTGDPTGCVLTFSAAFATAPKCVVTWQTNLAAMGYSPSSTTALTITQTGTSSNKINYWCN